MGEGVLHLVPSSELRKAVQSGRTAASNSMPNKKKAHSCPVEGMKINTFRTEYSSLLCVNIKEFKSVYRRDSCIL